MISAASGGALLSTLAFALALSPPPPTPIPPGTIYFNTVATRQNYQMKGDGSAKTLLGVPYSGNYPGRLLHGGHRWFLKSQTVPGTYPNGADRTEIFVIRDDNAMSVQLTDEPTENLFSMTWAPDESVTSATIGGFGRRFNPDGTYDLSGIGVYTATVQFDANGIPSISTPPEFRISVGVVSPTGFPISDAYGGLFDWSPDGTKIVLGNYARTELRTFDINSGEPTILLASSDPVFYPMWSPNGSKISFCLTTANSVQVHTITPAGTSRTTIMTELVNRWGTPLTIGRNAWSPDSAYVAYSIFGLTIHGAIYLSYDVCRVTAAGAGKTNLTMDFGGDANLFAWR